MVIDNFKRLIFFIVSVNNASDALIHFLSKGAISYYLFICLFDKKKRSSDHTSFKFLKVCIIMPKNLRSIQC